jgi:hypothetical protein
MSRYRILPALGIVLAACGGGGESDLATIPPTAAPSAAVDTTVTEPAPASSSSTSVATTVSVTTVAGAIGLSPDGPWRLVDSAPGITTPGLVYELMPKLWVYLPVTEDIANGITWTLNEPDRPLIEAYLQARLVFFRVTETNPFDLADPGWAEWYTDGGASYDGVLSERSSRGEVFDRDVGVVLRPVVLGEGRTDSEGIVFDCMLDGGVWRLPDGSLGADSTPGVAPNGVAAKVSLSDHWAINGLATQPEACQ